MAARDYRVEETLRNGTRVTIRGVLPADRERLTEAFAKLEQESVYTRFFTYKRELSPAELDRIAHLDFAREAMLVATTGTGDGEVVIGSAQYIADPTPGAPLAAPRSHSPSKRTSRGWGWRVAC